LALAGGIVVGLPVDAASHWIDRYFWVGGAGQARCGDPARRGPRVCCAPLRTGAMVGMAAGARDQCSAYPGGV